MTYHSISMTNEEVISNTSFESESLRPDSANGTLIIVVCKARHLPNRRTLDKQSPYVALRIGTIAKKTPSEFRAGQRPLWRHELRFDLTRERKPIMKVDVLDDCKNEPTPIGNCEIDCSIIFAEDKLEGNKYIHDDWYDLSQNGRRAGQIYLEMTFYPSAPVVPPKVPDNWSASNLAHSPSHQQAQVRSNSQSPTRSLSPHYSYTNASSPNSPDRKKTVVDEVFVNSLNSDKSSKHSSIFMRNSNNSTQTANSEIFVNSNNQEELKGGKKYLAKFNKLKDKFSAKEPIGKLWNESNHLQINNNTTTTKSPSPRNNYGRNISPISAYGIDDDEEDLDKLRKQMQADADDADDVSSEEIEFIKPPTPPPHTSKPASPRRKPPTEYNTSFNSIPAKVPFSADSMGLDDDGIDALSEKFDGLPGSVYNDSTNGYKPHRLNPNEIDPKNYAPTPDEHLNRRLKLQNGKGVTKDDLKIDLRTDKTGYLGNGKFSPSVFQRAVGHNYDGDQENNQMKPQVPPKIPQGLTEAEYYAIEKDTYLKDLNGRRF
ncbi:uncharacterized protein RJT21DRAFT_118520 [Scheffersomyces amazonensis]|uniref:uncharacterized protein n=1 Tax=Scheffersomyces amazonensis TaxID=1078765 RepID=UPI00315D31DB